MEPGRRNLPPPSRHSHILPKAGFPLQQQVFSCLSLSQPPPFRFPHGISQDTIRQSLPPRLLSRGHNERDSLQHICFSSFPGFPANKCPRVMQIGKKQIWLLMSVRPESKGLSAHLGEEAMRTPCSCNEGADGTAGEPSEKPAAPPSLDELGAANDRLQMSSDRASLPGASLSPVLLSALS